jgi:Sec-independent protein secretion pathway component TatC
LWVLFEVSVIIVQVAGKEKKRSENGESGET